MKTKNSHIQKSNEQRPLFSERSLLPDTFMHIGDLRPCHNLSAVFNECHNYIYANEGLLKEKIFHEMVKLLAMKLHDENTAKETTRFCVTSGEYAKITANAPGGFEKRVNRLFETTMRGYGNLFTDDALKLKPLTLAYIISRLQHFSLTQTPGDIKGEAFQVFVDRRQRGDRGEFFTPYPIVRMAVEMMSPKPGESVIDPACGSGGFLTEAIAYVQRGNPDMDKSSYIREHIRGTEFNPDVAVSAMIRLEFEGGTGAEITCANALMEDRKLDHSFDVILTNPPFGNRKGPGSENSHVIHSARRWKKLSHKTWKPAETLLPGQSPDILFIERCLKLLKPEGRMAIVLPDGLLQNVSNSHIRFWIRSQAGVLGVVSIPHEAFIPYGTGIKTSLLLLQKFPAVSRHHCFMARMQKIGYDVKGQPVCKRDDHGRPVKTSEGECIIDDDVKEIASAYSRFREGETETQNEKIYHVPEECLESRLDPEHYHPGDQRLIALMKSAGARPLGEIAEILNKTDDFRMTGNREIRYIAISDVDFRTMQVVSQQTIKTHEAPSRATYRIRKGDIITATSGASTGTKKQATVLITQDEDGAICSNGFAVLRNIQKVEPLFLLAYMRTAYYLRQVRRLMTGHAIPAISADDLSRVLVPVPPKEKQEAIA